MTMYLLIFFVCLLVVFNVWLYREATRRRLMRERVAWLLRLTASGYVLTRAEKQELEALREELERQGPWL